MTFAARYRIAKVSETDSASHAVSQVYDVSQWMGKHPGGHEVIRHWAGKDASASFHAFHPVWAEKPRKASNTQC